MIGQTKARRHFRGGGAAAAPGGQGTAGAPAGGGGKGAKRRHFGLWATFVAVLIVAAGAALTASVAWPRLSLGRSTSALASFSTHGPGVRLASATASAGGRTVSLVAHGSTLDPVSALPPGGPVDVSLTASTPGWIGWIAGHSIEASIVVPAPAARLTSPMVVAAPGSQLSATFSEPVSVVDWSYQGARHVQHLATPSRTVALAVPATANLAGSVTVSASPYAWEAPSAPQTLSFFFSKSGTVASVSPAPGSTNLSPTTPLLIHFSKPVASVLGQRLPTLNITLVNASPAGKWVRPDPYTLEFQPAAGALWPGQAFTVQLPTAVDVVTGARSSSMQTLSYSVSQGSVTRLQQLLAKLGYLPLNWTRATGTSSATSLSSQEALAITPPNGTFSWRWQPPARLAALWQQGTYTVMTKGAVMAFEHVAGLNTVGRSNPLLWQYLIKAALANKANPYGYSWADVSKSLPEHLTLWHNGKVVLTALTNTGIPVTPTHSGTYPVYLRYASQTMTGTNPNGSHYSDFVRWVNYFNGGDAIHGFVRASYGFPQSLGCVELPFSTAGKVWPYLHIGSLVTVHP